MDNFKRIEAFELWAYHKDECSKFPGNENYKSRDRRVS